MKIIFLDFDGVMIPASDNTMNNAAFHPACVERLNRLLEETDARLVISSYWQTMGEYTCVGALQRNGIDPSLLHEHWGTGASLGVARWVQIQKWVEDHPEVTQWVAIDDAPIERLGTHAIQCDTRYGFTEKLYEQAREKLNA